jgi:Arc/MetJ-type ribon-helix-helix transcriptional regulator
MSKKTVTVELPAELVEKMQQVNADLSAFIAEAVRRDLERLGMVPHRPMNERMPTQEEIDAAVRESAARNASGLYPKRQLGLMKGQIWMSDDFDDPLPESFWLGEDA